MRVLILSQVYWPDTASTAQHLVDLGEAMVEAGHEVVVLASRHAYEDPAVGYVAEEVRGGVRIKRMRHTGLGKGAVWRRLVDFLTFNVALVWRLVWMKRSEVEVVLGMTSPPLVSFIGVLVARWKGWRFCYWAMDLQPELAIEAGMVKRGSAAALGLEWMGNVVFRRADRIVALDDYMAKHIRSRGGREVVVSAVWPVMQEGWKGERLANPFRVAHGFGDKIVVMYSGNHAVVHPLETLLGAAKELREDERFLFVFVGGGVRVGDVTRWKEAEGLTNVWQLPYQPREMIHISLTAADLHVVIMGDGQVGYTHPNKVYGAMFVGRPFIYIGPQPSHVTDLAVRCAGNLMGRHGEVEQVVEELMRFAQEGEGVWRATGERNERWARVHFSPAVLIAAMVGHVGEWGDGDGR